MKNWRFVNRGRNSANIFGEYFAANDAEGVASLCAEDADRFANVSEKAVGRAEVMEQYRASLERRKTAFPTFILNIPYEDTFAIKGKSAL